MKIIIFIISLAFVFYQLDRIEKRIVEVETKTGTITKSEYNRKLAELNERIKWGNFEK